MALPRKSYTVLKGFPIGGGHWSRAGQVLDLLDVEAHGLESAGRIKLTAQVEAEAAAAAAVTTTKAAKGAAAKDAE